MLAHWKITRQPYAAPGCSQLIGRSAHTCSTREAGGLQWDSNPQPLEVQALPLSHLLLPLLTTGIAWTATSNILFNRSENWRWSRDVKNIFLARVLICWKWNQDRKIHRNHQLVCYCLWPVFGAGWDTRSSSHEVGRESIKFMTTSRSCLLL